MKTFNLKIGLREILALVIIVILFNFGFNSVTGVYEVSAERFKFGKVILTDTLDGTLKVNTGGIYTPNTLEFGDMQTADGYFDFVNNYVLGLFSFYNNSPAANAGMDFYVDKSSGQFRFYVDDTNRVEIDNSGLIVENDITSNGILKNDGLVINEVSTKPATPTQDTQARMYVKGDHLIVWFNSGGTDRFFSINLASGTDQQWIYSGSEP